MKHTALAKRSASPALARLHHKIEAITQRSKAALHKAKARTGAVVNGVVDIAVGGTAGFALGVIDGRFGRDESGNPEPIKIMRMPLPAAAGAAFHIAGFVGDLLGWKFARHLHTLGQAGVITFSSTLGYGVGSAWAEKSK